MSTGNVCLAVVPARGGSKRVPGKNIRRLRGKPLLAYTLEAAQESGLFQRVVVTTDSAEIAEVAREFGAEVPFLREASLSDDLVPVSSATLDALERIDPAGDAITHVCQLMANCPLRSARDISDSFEQLMRTGAAAQISVVRYGWQNPWWAMRRDESLVLAPLFEEAVTTRSQDLPELFCPTGAVWWARSDALRREGSFHMSGRTGWEIPWQRGVDIDTQEDWEMANAIMTLEEEGHG